MENNKPGSPSFLAIFDPKPVPTTYAHISSDDDSAPSSVVLELATKNEPAKPNAQDAAPQPKQEQVPAAQPKRPLWRSVSAMDVLSGVVTFVYAMATVMVSASAVFLSPRLAPHLASLVSMYVLGAAVSGVVIGFMSNLRTPCPNPDPFPVPFLLVMIDILDKEFPTDDHAFFTNVMFSVILCHVFLGLAHVFAGTFRLMRFSDFIPYPVVCGLLAGIGTILVKICMLMTLSNPSDRAIKLVVTILFGLCFLKSREWKSTITMPSLFVVGLAAFFGIAHLLHWTNEHAQSRGWMFPPQSDAASSRWRDTHMSIFSIDFSVVSGRTFVLIAPQLAALLLLFVLKSAVMYPSFERLIGHKIELNRELIALGSAMVVAGVAGTGPCSIGPSVLNLMRSISPTPYIPGVIFTVLFGIAFFFQLASYLSVVPVFMFSGLLFANGFGLLRVWLFSPYKFLPWTEWAIVLLIVVVSLAADLLVATGIGAGISVLLFAHSMSSVGCVKFLASGLIFRSTVDRTLAQKDFLDQHGDHIQIMQLQGYIFFGNASKIVTHVKTLSTGAPQGFSKNAQTANKPSNEANSTTPPPSDNNPTSTNPNATMAGKDANHSNSTPTNHGTTGATTRTFLIIDMPFVLGMDTSAVDWFGQSFRTLGERCTVCISGAPIPVRQIIERRKDVFGGVHLFDDLDAAVESCEEIILAPTMENENKWSDSSRDVGAQSGFERCLQLIERRHGTRTANLAKLKSFVRAIRLQEGEVLMNQPAGTRVDMKRDGLFFVEHGSIKIERNPEQSLTLRSQLLDLKENRQEARIRNRNFRLTRIGAGWVLGAQELLSGYRTLGVYVAETPSRVHYLPFSTVKRLEKEDPALMVDLLYLLGKVIAETSDRSKDQLSYMMDMIYTYPGSYKSAVNPIVRAKNKLL